MKFKHLFIWLILLAVTACQATPTPAPTAVPTSEAVTEEAPEATATTVSETLIYTDPEAAIGDRIDDLLARMTLEEKIGQMTLVEKNSLKPEDVTTHFIGSVLSGGGGYPPVNSPEKWAEMVAEFKNAAAETRLGIPLIYGVDAVHGHNNVEGAVIFPHQIGLGATRDTDLVERIGRATAAEVAATNIFWDYAPVVAVARDIRWGRIYEVYGEDTELVTNLGLAYMRGLQGDNLSDPTTILATPKHFLGDGGTTWGTSMTDNYQLDQGDTQVDEATMRAVYLPPYKAAVDAGALSIMISFSSWNGAKMHGQRYWITDVLKDELGFEGFVVSDWGGIDQIDANYYEAVVTAINAGIDMNMVPYDYGRFIRTLTKAVESGDVPQARIDDAVRRILRAKFALGLFERPLSDEALLDQVGSEAHRELAREAVAKSLVLLKNDDETLPLSKDTPHIFVGGQAADDIGIQCGGWTIEWQGGAGSITPGTTILEGIEAAVGEGTEVAYNRFGKFERITDENDEPIVADVGIAVVGELPYAEGKGDRADLSLPEADLAMIERMRERSEKLVVVLISGRPMIITEYLDTWDAFAAAWLPGTEGDGVADVLFGDQPFTGKLPVTWPRTIDQLPFDFDDLATSGDQAPLFPFGYGLE